MTSSENDSCKFCGATFSDGEWCERPCPGTRGVNMTPAHAQAREIAMVTLAPDFGSNVDGPLVDRIAAALIEAERRGMEKAAVFCEQKYAAEYDHSKRKHAANDLAKDIRELAAKVGER